MTTAAVLQRQGGRPIKKVPKGERTQIGVIVGGNIKALLLKAMKDSGRTISREAEHRIEKSFAYDEILAAHNERIKLMNTFVPVSRSVGLVPASMSEAMQLANMMATAKLVPEGLQKSPADCLMVIQQAIRWQMDPFAVAQECSVIKGKLMHSGKLVAAVINTNGNLVRRLSFEYKGEGDNRTITVSGQLQGEPQARTVEVILKNAVTSNIVWKTQTDQQLMYHGARVWARRHTPELMLGVRSPEEMPEEFDEPPPPPRKTTRAAPNVALHDPETGEITDDKPEHSAPAPAPAPLSTPAVAGAGLSSEAVASHDKLLADAAERGTAELMNAWGDIPNYLRMTLKSALDRRHKPRATEVDAMGRS